MWCAWWGFFGSRCLPAKFYKLWYQTNWSIRSDLPTFFVSQKYKWRTVTFHTRHLKLFDSGSCYIHIWVEKFACQFNIICTHKRLKNYLGQLSLRRLWWEDLLSLCKTLPNISRVFWLSTTVCCAWYHPRQPIIGTGVTKDCIRWELLCFGQGWLYTRLWESRSGDIPVGAGQ